MAALEKLRKQQVPLIVNEFFSRCRLAEERRVLESRAVVIIQAYVRGFLIRRRLLRLAGVATTVQRYWRGYLGRLRARRALEEHNRALRQAYFSAKATVVQKWWRGYFSRKNVHDYYARKAYLRAVRERNEDIRSELAMEAERAILLQRQEAEERARRLFEEKVGKLHHLVSTANQPGIFNSPYGLATGTLPIIMGLPVEEHLKASMRAQLSQSKLPPLLSSSSGGGGNTGGGGSGKLFKSSKGVPAYSATAVVDGRAVPARFTLRQTAEYGAVHQSQLLEEKIHRGEMLTQHPMAFTSSLGKAKAPLFDLQTNRNLERYLDPSDPTVGVRNETFTPEQQKISSSAFLKYTKKQPFFDKNITEAY